MRHMLLGLLYPLHSETLAEHISCLLQHNKTFQQSPLTKQLHLIAEEKGPPLAHAAKGWDTKARALKEKLILAPTVSLTQEDPQRHSSLPPVSWGTEKGLQLHKRRPMLATSDRGWGGGRVRFHLTCLKATKQLRSFNSAPSNDTE